MRSFCENCQEEVDIISDQVTQGKICSLCGSPCESSSESNSSLTPGRMINGFQIESELGRGGMGVVYKAKQLNLDRYVALKILSSKLAHDAEFIESFFKEARSAASLNHPNIVQAFDAGIEENLYYFAMELIDGGTLEAKVEKKGKLPHSEVLDIAIKIAKALEYSWERQRLTHGDIKPENIIINSMGEVKLADLGLAKSAYDETLEHELMLTPLYAPPEIIQREIHRMGPQSDMYSFGATLYHLLSGSPPFPGDNPEDVCQKHLTEVHIKLTQHDKKLSPVFSGFIDHLLSKNPEDRPDSWSEVVNELKHIHLDKKILRVHHSHKNGSSKKEEPVQEPQNSKKKSLFFLIILAVFIFGSALAGVFLLGKSDDKTPNTGVSVKPKPKPNPNPADNARTKEEKRLAALRLQQLKNKKLQKKFRALVDVTIKKMSKSNIDKLNASELSALIREIDNVFKQLNAKKLLKPIVTQKEAEILLKYEKEAKARIKRLAKDDAEKKAQLIAKRKAERLRLKKEREKLKEKKLAKNKVIDGYYLVLGSYLKGKKKAYVFESKLRAWSNLYKNKLFDESLKKHNYIQKAFFDTISIQNVFCENDFLLKGKRIYHRDNLKEFKVKSVDSTYINLSYTNNKGTFAAKSKWSGLKKRDYIKLVKKRMLKSKKIRKLSEKHHYSVLFFLLNNEMFKEAEYYLKHNLKINSSNKEILNSIINDFRHGELEANAILSWREILRKENGRNGAVLARLSKTFDSKYKSTYCYKRYKVLINNLFSKLHNSSPDFVTSFLSDTCSRGLSKDRNTGAINMAMVLNARYAGLKTLSVREKRQVKFNKEKAILEIKARNRNYSIRKSKLPSYYWENSKIGVLNKYTKQLKNRARRFKESFFVSSLGLASDLNIADWDKAEEIFELNKNKYEFLLDAEGKIQNWRLPILFNYGVVANRFQDKKRDHVLRIMQRVAEREIDDDSENPNGIDLFLEFALRNRNADKAISYARRYELWKKKLGIRTALLTMLQFLQDKENQKSVKWLLKEYSRKYDSYSDFILWSKMAVDILEGDRKIARNQIYQLRNSRCKERNLSARILIDALAQACCYGKSPTFTEGQSDIWRLLNTITYRMSSNPVGSELWEKQATFKLALNVHDIRRFKSALTSFMKDYRMCTVEFYPELLKLKAGVALVEKKIDKNTIRKNYDTFIDGCSLVSFYDRKTSTVITSNEELDIIKEMFDERAYKTAYWTSVMAILKNLKDKSKLRAIFNTLKPYNKYFSWQEKFLLLKMYKKYVN